MKFTSNLLNMLNSLNLSMMAVVSNQTRSINCNLTKKLLFMLNNYKMSSRPNQALHLTAIPLRSIAAGDLYR